MAGQSVAFRLGERSHRFGERDVVHGGPMHMQHVHVVHLQIPQALVHGACEVGGSQVFMRHLGAQEYLRAWNARCTYALPDALFRSVLPCRVDVPVAELECGRHYFAAISEL